MTGFIWRAFQWPALIEKSNTFSGFSSGNGEPPSWPVSLPGVAKPPRSVLAISVNGIEPPMPPVPFPWKLPFQPVAGIHTSILISDSLVGFRVAVTRQKAGRFLNGAAASPRPPLPAGGVKAPAATVAADVIVVLGNDREARLSHGTAATDA